MVVFALLGIVLVWAPKNELSCLYIFLSGAGTFEVEYMYFCGLKIGTEVLGAMSGAHGFEVTSEVGHALGAFLGFGIGAAFVKLNWVDCENWDIFAYAQNKHGNMESVGSWQDTAAVSIRKDRKIETPVLGDDDDGIVRTAKKGKKRKALPKLKELSSLDDDIPDDDDDVYDGPIEVIEEASSRLKAKNTTSAKATPPPPPIPAVPSIPVKQVAQKTSLHPKTSVPAVQTSALADTTPLGRIRTALNSDKPDAALAEYRRQKAADPTFQLPMAELRGMGDAFYKQQNVRDSRPFLEEYLERFPEEADRQRVKLAVLYIKYLKKPTAALKLLVKVNRGALPEEYQTIHTQAARQAQQMISEGMVDAT